MQIYDFVGIGFGPANIALAIALEESDASKNYIFLERNSAPGWQNNMLLSDSDIQNHPLRDLVTPANPRSFYSFTNYLHTQNRLFEYLNLGITFPMRREYSNYVIWVAEHFSSKVKYSIDVRKISLTNQAGEKIYKIETDERTILARSVVLAPGRTPNIPATFDDVVGDSVFHLTQYESQLTKLKTRLEIGGSIAVVGGSQSAVEIILDLTTRFPNAVIHSVQRAYGFRLKDTSPFSEEVYFPEFVDYYFKASTQGKRILNEELKATNYSSVDGDVLHKLYLKLYTQKLEKNQKIQMHRSSEISTCELTSAGYRLCLKERLTGELSSITVNGVVLATGFKNFGRGVSEEPVHPLMFDIQEHFVSDQNNGLKINRNYSLEPKHSNTAPPFFINGLCESSHGFGDAGSFSILSLRAREIATALSMEVYSKGEVKVAA